MSPRIVSHFPKVIRENLKIRRISVNHTNLQNGVLGLKNEQPLVNNWLIYIAPSF